MRPLNTAGGAHSAAGNALRETRQNEKKQLSELNDRFAGYVERVRFLEAQNKKLQIELDVLKSKWGQETKYIEKMYQIELEEARSVLNDTSKTKDGLQVKLDRSEQELEDVRKRYFDVESLLNKDKEKIASLQDQIAANESEIGLLRRRLCDLQDEEKRYKAEAQRMMSEIQRVSFELECEIKQRLSLENDKQSLEEELLFLKEVHSKELDELKHLSLRESGIDPSAFFKSEKKTHSLCC
jgi:chromosome segregation ATPase